mgnify:CR=1 FL=1
MQFIAEGLLLGLTLAILIGPIFVALTQTGMQNGLKAGIAVGTGVWVSDILVISAAYLFIHQLNEVVQNSDFHFWMGMSGGLILMATGLYTFMKTNIEVNEKFEISSKTYFGYFTKGFLVNFINPFTFIFWIGVMSTNVIGRNINGLQTILLFGSIMIVIVFTDSLKVLMAKMIRTKVSKKQITYISKMAGALLILFGIGLLYKTNIIPH